MATALRLRLPLRAVGFLAVLAAAALAAALVPGAVSHAAPSSSDLTKQIKQQSTKFDKLVEAYNKVTEERKDTQAKIKSLNAKIRTLTDDVATGRKQVGELAAEAYRGGTASAWNSLLDGAGGNMVNGIATLDRIGAHRSAQLKRLVAAGKKLNARRGELADASAAQARQQKDLAGKKSSISDDIAHLKVLRKKAYGREQETADAAGSAGPPPPVSGRAGTVVRFAYAQLGKPYVWAADGPDSYDCSGLTLAAWRQVGVNLPHLASAQYNQIPHVTRSQAQPGDLVFYEDLGHVAVYIGGGRVIHAPTFGEVVKVSSIDMMPVYGIGRP
ncbi:MAG: NlpC/P60 family protein [Actinocatenispora sp.]